MAPQTPAEKFSLDLPTTTSTAVEQRLECLIQRVNESLDADEPAFAKIKGSMRTEVYDDAQTYLTALRVAKSTTEAALETSKRTRF